MRALLAQISAQAIRVIVPSKVFRCIGRVLSSNDRDFSAALPGLTANRG
jgi:hypothetical protein